MSAMVVSQSERIMSHPKETFVNCTSLPLKQRTLTQKDMGSVDGGNPLIVPFLVGVAAGVTANYIYNNWDEIVDTVGDVAGSAVDHVDAVIDSHSRFIDEYVW